MFDFDETLKNCTKTESKEKITGKSISTLFDGQLLNDEVSLKKVLINWIY